MGWGCTWVEIRSCFWYGKSFNVKNTTSWASTSGLCFALLSKKRPKFDYFLDKLACYYFYSAESCSAWRLTFFWRPKESNIDQVARTFLKTWPINAFLRITSDSTILCWLRLIPASLGYLLKSLIAQVKCRRGVWYLLLMVVFFVLSF